MRNKIHDSYDVSGLGCTGKTHTTNLRTDSPFIISLFVYLHFNVLIINEVFIDVLSRTSSHSQRKRITQETFTTKPSSTILLSPFYHLLRYTLYSGLLVTKLRLSVSFTTVSYHGKPTGIRKWLVTMSRTGVPVQNGDRLW